MTSLIFVSLLSPHLHGFYTGLLAQLSGTLGQRVDLLSSGDWSEDRRAVAAAEVDGAFQCGLILQQHPAYLPVAAPVPLGQGQAVYATHVVVRQESTAQQFADLGGGRWVYNDPTSFSGYVALHAHAARLDLPPGFFGAPHWSGSHLASLDAVLGGEADAAGIDSTVFSAVLRARPVLRRSLRVLTTLGPFPIPPVTLRRTLPPALHQQIQAALAELHTQPTGRALLREAGFSRFVPTTEAAYLPLLAEAAHADHWRHPAPHTQRSAYV
ncbi:phosphate/phosphite/phosphonate ABC transporter substrate-binding protein [Deinococcus sp. Arct2-2]|uniref:phosphate/phosphite/phosphonate ABC transporter substrate-binding protein n=1 Tax=Deinococcus sp. Arct2-2 TaxID=2568653 RepID=UPI001454D5BF|nr:phosphate/phosphite/phosphonate ABC transporter substrate-binding protein [Deinococcus sp. Arct2-2]